MAPEQRRATRQPLVAVAEVIDLKSDTRWVARTADLSPLGCYLDLINPLPPGTEVSVRITHRSGNFTARGKVIYSLPQMGMGISFTNLADDQRALLEKWLAELSQG